MPEDAQLALQLRTVSHRLHQIVYAEILMILGDDLALLVAEHDEVFDVIDQALLAKQTVNEIPHGTLANCRRFLDCFSVRMLFLGVHLQPLKEVVVSRIKGADSRFQPVGKDTDLIERKEIRNIPQIVFQINVIRFLHLDDAVFQLDEHHRQTVDED